MRFYTLHSKKNREMSLRIPSEMKTCFATQVIFLWFMGISFSLLACGEGCSEDQNRALLQIRDSTNGSAFADWDGRDCCEAKGIFCESRFVSGIHLDDSLAPSSKWHPNVTLFTLFDKLEELKLSSTQIGGRLDPFCQLKQLKYLTRLDLRNNTLEGNIPSCLGMFENLEELILSNNDLRGNVPSSIFSNQSKIVRFSISNNQLKGLLSFSIFANASSLNLIDLSYNNLEVETESSSWIPTFRLSYLHLANCSLNKRNGHGVPSFISTQFSLAYLDLSNNSIEMDIPCWLIFNTSVRVLSLKSNKIHGSLDECLANRTSLLFSLDISNNHIRGRLPKKIGDLFLHLNNLDMSSNALQGIIPWSLGNLHLKSLDLSNNKFSGIIPRSLTKSGTQIVYLNLSNNKLKGKMLPKDSNMTWLECLQLSGNHFIGSISPMISNSPSLVILDVGNNQLSGKIPKWLYDHPRLVAILLGGNYLKGPLLQKMCHMKRLQVFDISNNHVSGSIPHCLDNITFWKKNSPNSTYSNYFSGWLNQLFNLPSQTLFVVVEIKMPSGVEEMLHPIEIGMPLRIKKMVYTFKGIPLSMMTILDMSSNQLTGNLPFEVGELSQLRSLNLSNNLLIGHIPNSFRNLTNMESLDLSHNKLSGEIPYELVGLTSLSLFNVAYNNLSGKIPCEQQFSTFDIQSYDGNPGLCGNPLPRNCSMINGLEQEHKTQNKEGTRMVDNPLLFYAFVAISYIFGFWVFFGILIINNNWRQTYFRCVDRYIESCFGMLFKYY